MSDVAGLWTIIICVFFSAYFSASETAYNSVNKVRLKNLDEKGNIGARRTLQLLENYEKLQESLKKRKAEMTGEDDGNAAEETNEDATPGDGQAPGPDVKMTESSTEKETEMSQESKNVNAVLRSVIIMVILVAIIMFASFYSKSKKREG